MANEPSWDEIFGTGEPTRPAPQQAQRSSPEPTVPGYPGVRASDPFAVAAAQAREVRQASSATLVTDAPVTRRQLRETQGSGGSRRGGGEPPSKRKRPRRLVWLWALVGLLVLGGAAATAAWVLYEDKVRAVLGWELANDYEGVGNGTEVVIVIQSGDFGADVATALHDAGVTKSFDAVWEYLLAHPEVTFTPGNFRLQEEMSAEAAITALQDPANRIVNAVTIPEGTSYRDALELISAGTEIPLEELEAQAADYAQFGVPSEAPSIEGYLFPATYQFDPGITANGAIKMLVDEMFSRLDAAGVAPADRHTVLTMAALVQRESGPNVEDMHKIARVFQNRLDEGMRLESDATVTYGTGNTHTVWTEPEDRADTRNPYNTYAHLGLPIGPIGLPGSDAIDAALDPADGPWLFFVTVNLQTGETVFSETVAQHEAAVAQLRAWCRASEENASYCE